MCPDRTVNCDNSYSRTFRKPLLFFLHSSADGVTQAIVSAIDADAELSDKGVRAVSIDSEVRVYGEITEILIDDEGLELEPSEQLVEIPALGNGLAILSLFLLAAGSWLIRLQRSGRRNH